MPLQIKFKERVCCMRKLALTIFLLVSVLTFSGVLHFPNADVVYPEGLFEIGVLVGNIFESIRQPVIDLIGKDPGRINIVIQDRGALSNGSTMPVLHKTIILYTWPPEGTTFSQLPLENWYTYLLIHEFTHMVHLTYQGLLPKIFSIFSGLPYILKDRSLKEQRFMLKVISLIFQVD